MFEQATLSGGPLSTRLWSTFAGVGGQAFVVGATLLVPLIWPAALPQLQSYITLQAPGPPPPPPSPPEGYTVRPKPVRLTDIRCNFCAPPTVPNRIETVVDDPPQLMSDNTGVSGGLDGVRTGVPNSLLDTVMRGGNVPPTPPPVAIVKPPAPPPPPAAPARYRIGGNVKPPIPVRRVDPVYPPLARTAHIEGVVELEGVIGADGRIHELKAKSGHMFLIPAALDAVRQWIYTPATLNGDPVEVIAPITVTFRLGH
jgi:protein TonB